MNHRYFQLTRCVSQSIIHVDYMKSLNAYLARRWAGHAKWQNAKADKEQAAKFKNMHFSKLSKDIALAVREGGDNPNNNTKLKNLLETARKYSMTSATVQKAIERGKGSQSSKPYWVAYTGPLNLQVGFEVTYTPQAKFQSECGPKLKKVGLKTGKNLSDFCVEKGIIVCKPLNGVEKGLDKALEDGIEVGACEVFDIENKSLVFECPPDRVDSIESQLSKKGYVVESSGTEIEFHEMIKLSKEDLEKITTALNKIVDNHDEVQRFSLNVEIQ